MDNYSRPIIVSTGGLVEDEAMGVVYWSQGVCGGFR